MAENSTHPSGGVGFFGLLTIAFIVLKLCKVITWSWWLVLLPLWVGLGITITVLIVLMLILFAASRYDCGH